MVLVLEILVFCYSSECLMRVCVGDMAVPGLMGLLAAAIVAAAMSSLDSSLNSMATVTTIDFYQKFFRKNETPEHYLKASRVFTIGWSFFIVLPALMFIGSDGSVLEILSKIGSFFVGAKLSTFFLGFYSRHTTEKGLLAGVAIGFALIAVTDIYGDVAWPWYCLIGGAASIVGGWVCSVLISGFQSEYHEYSVPGQEAEFKASGKPIKQDGWYVLPGKIDKSAYWLIAYLVVCLIVLYLFNAII